MWEKIIWVLHHPYWWLKLDHTADAIQAIAAILAIPWIIAASVAARRQAIAADKQAGAAEAQTLAANVAASHARRQYKLERKIMIASNRPALVVGSHGLADGSLTYYVQNQGPGMAYLIVAGLEFRDDTVVSCRLGCNRLGPGYKTSVSVDQILLRDHRLKVSCVDSIGNLHIIWARVDGPDISIEESTVER